MPVIFHAAMIVVSTHSRPKAAGPLVPSIMVTLLSFNTQPPEGGWLLSDKEVAVTDLFQHTAARRRLG